MLKKSFILLATLITLYGLLHLTDLDDRLHYLVNSGLTDTDQTNDNIGLDRYWITAPPQPVESVQNNLSGITFHPPTDTLFAITNSPCRIYELTKNGALLRVIDLTGFEDTEGIVYVQDDLFAVIEERRHTLHLLQITEDTRTIDLKQALKSLTIDIKSTDNLGFEGLAYDPIRSIFFITNEKEQQQIIKITGWLTGSLLQIQIDPNIINRDLYMDDFSGLHFDVNSGNLVFLSDESKMITEVTLQGQHVSYMDLESGFSGLNKDIPQPEGITLDQAGSLYIVSEPNLFYRFMLQPRNQSEEQSAK